ncbi:long-chain fatty acid--CoA ligase [archaeon]|nr:MAG: long-chain fatty acid--CoA ligase [archaeon]
MRTLAITSVKMNIEDFLESVVPSEAALQEYGSLLSCYDDGVEKSGILVKYYNFVEEQGKKTICELAYSHSDFLRLVTQVIVLFTSKSISKGTRVLHNFSGNRIEDLIIRAAAVFLGFVPVTVNWQADSVEQIKYKLEATEAKAVVFDNESLAVSELKATFPDITFLHHKEIYQSLPIEDFLAWISANSNGLPLSTDTRCIIFTSGTTGKPKGIINHFIL